jgi:nucleoid DNA-binding protein
LDITAFIRELLFGHDCVIVPGFGGFIGNYTPAHIDKNAGIFYPPVKQISFNRNLNHNDGLLVGKISESANLSYVNSKILVDEFVGELRRKLEKGEKVLFDNIGSFVNNQEGNIQFEPDKSANYHLDSYGLESFQCLPLEGYDVRKRVLRHTGKDPVRVTFTRKNLWRAAIIIPLLSLLIVVPLKIDRIRTKIESTTMNPLASAEFEHNKQVMDGGIKVDSAKVETKIEPVPEKTAAPVAAISVAAESKTYFLITGSFKSEENAVSQINMLKTEGFAPEIVTTSNGFYRVCAMAFSDMNTAVFKKDSIAKKFPGAWISKKK